MSAHTFRLNGPLESILEDTIGTFVSESGPASPTVYTVVELTNDALLADLTYEMNRAGWSYVEQASRRLPSLARVERAKLDSDGSAIQAIAGWVAILDVDVDSGGSTTLEAEASGGFGVAIGGQARLVIDGGSFSDSVLLTRDMPVLAGGVAITVKTYVELPSGAETYNVSLQVAATALGSITPRAGSSLIVKEYAP